MTSPANQLPVAHDLVEKGIRLRPNWLEVALRESLEMGAESGEVRQLSPDGQQTQVRKEYLLSEQAAFSISTTRLAGLRTHPKLPFV